MAGGRLRGLDVVPRSWVLSAGSGVSVAYVFVHLLPEVAALEERLGDEVLGWLVALGGLVVVYGLELRARRSRSRGHGSDLDDWVHLTSYAVYNGIVGYLLVERAELGATQLWTFALAMALHFLVNDRALREDHEQLYRRAGRWLVAAGVLVGATLGLVVRPTGTVLELLLAFLAGGVVMNVIKEELPESQRSRFVPFALAAGGYAALLLVV